MLQRGWNGWPVSFNRNRSQLLLFKQEDKEVCQSHYRWIDGIHLPFETPIHPSVPTVIVERLCGSSFSGTDSLGRSFRKSCLLETSLQHNQACRLNISGFGWVRREWGCRDNSTGKHGWLSQHGAIRMTKQVSFSIFSSTFKRRGMGGNAYANIPSQDRDIASTAQAKGSWNGDTKVSSWLFSLVANRSMCGTSQKWKIWDRVPMWRVHSVLMICPFLESESASTFSLPGTNLAVRDTSFVQISHHGCVVC